MGSNQQTFATAETPSTLNPRLIREQVDRMLAHPLFSRSKRYPPFLRHIVENALSDHPEHVKERTLGVEVLGRKPDYDTNQDPVVRVTAGEIRQRIAQYYHESGHESELRIELPAGSYMPEFHQPPANNEVLSEARAVRVFRRRSNLKMIVGGLIFAGLAIAFLVMRSGGAQQNAVDQFWNPILNQRSPLLITVAGCNHQIPSTTASNSGAPPPVPASRVSLNYSTNQAGTRPCSMSTITFADALALSRIAGIPQAKGKPYEVKQASFVSFEDLRNQPVVLIGAFDNPWTMRLASTMRYCFQHDSDADVGEIVDKSDPTKHWSIPYHWQDLPPDQMIKDYALVSRLNDPRTEQMLVLAGGLGSYGTQAAGEFLSNPKYLNSFISEAPVGWSKRNFQLVLETDVINDNPGQPHVIASQFW
jgi:hypothetical protein